MSHVLDNNKRQVILAIYGASHIFIYKPIRSNKIYIYIMSIAIITSNLTITFPLGVSLILVINLTTKMVQRDVVCPRINSNMSQEISYL